MRGKTYFIALGGLLVLAAVVAVGVTGFRYVQVRAEEQARTSSLQAAREYAETMFGWTPDNVADHVNASMAVVTGEAKTQYEERVIDGRVVEQARQTQRSSEIEIVDAGVVSNTRDTSKVLIFMRQTIREAGKEETIGLPALSRLTYDLKYSGGKWLIANIDVINDHTVAERLGIADGDATASAVPIPDSPSPQPGG